MALITTYLYFDAKNISLPNTLPSLPEGEVLAGEIARLEPKFLTEILGYTLYQFLLANDTDTSGSYYDLLNGADFTDKLSRANHWQGLKTVGFNPIANYIYFNIQDSNRTSTFGIGERKAKTENMDNADPTYKMLAAWNDMVEMLWVMDDFLRQNVADYPTYLGIDYPPFTASSYVKGCEPHLCANNQYFQIKTSMF